MSRISYVNGRYVHHHEAVVHIEDRGYQFSDGIYEYVAFYNRRLLDGELHFKRLERSLRELQIPLPMPVEAMKVIVRELIERNGRLDGGLYIQVTRGVARRDHAFPKGVKPALIMTVCASKLPRVQEVQHGVTVITQPDIRWGRRDIKSVSLLANILAKQEAASVGAREAWLVDGGVVSEGSASNVYIVSRSGQLVTHPANELILGGVTRDVLLKLAQKASIPVLEQAFTMQDVKAAAEAFLTSTSANVLPVVQVDGSAVGGGKPGPVTRRLMDLYAAHVFKQTGKRL
jgi:D-alanine transaminase